LCTGRFSARRNREWDEDEIDETDPADIARQRDTNSLVAVTDELGSADDFIAVDGLECTWRQLVTLHRRRGRPRARLNKGVRQDDSNAEHAAIAIAIATAFESGV
jgi:hypothetical protein